MNCWKIGGYSTVKRRVYVLVGTMVTRPSCAWGTPKRGETVKGLRGRGALCSTSARARSA